MNQAIIRRVIARLIAMPILAALIAFFGGFTASLIGAAVFGLLGAIVYTQLDERLIRRRLFGKIGTNPLVWWVTHAVYETIAIALISFGAFAIMGWHVGTIWVAVVGALFGWVWLTSETLGNIMPLLMLLSSMRR